MEIEHFALKNFKLITEAIHTNIMHYKFINIGMTRIMLHVVSWQHSKSITYLHNNAVYNADFNYYKTAIL